MACKWLLLLQLQLWKIGFPFLIFLLFKSPVEASPLLKILWLQGMVSVSFFNCWVVYFPGDDVFTEMLRVQNVNYFPLLASHVEFLFIDLMLLPCMFLTAVPCSCCCLHCWLTCLPSCPQLAAQSWFHCSTELTEALDEKKKTYFYFLCPPNPTYFRSNDMW